MAKCRFLSMRLVRNWKLSKRHVLNDRMRRSCRLKQNATAASTTPMPKKRVKKKSVSATKRVGIHRGRKIKAARVNCQSYSFSGCRNTNGDVLFVVNDFAKYSPVGFDLMQPIRVVTQSATWQTLTITWGCLRQPAVKNKCKKKGKLLLKSFSGGVHTTTNNIITPTTLSTNNNNSFVVTTTAPSTARNSSEQQHWAAAASAPTRSSSINISANQQQQQHNSSSNNFAAAAVTRLKGPSAPSSQWQWTPTISSLR